MYFALFSVLVALLVIILHRLNKDYEILSLCRRIKTLDNTPLEHSVAIGRGRSIFGSTFDLINLSYEEFFNYFRYYALNLKRSYVQYIICTPIYNVIDADDAELVLNHNSLITKGDLYMFLKPFLRSGLLISTEQKWHNRRKLLTPAFHFKILEQFNEIFKQESEKYIENLQEILESKEGSCVINLEDTLSRFTLNSICETALGIKLDECQSGDDYRQSIRIAEDSFIKRIMNPLWASDFLYNTFGDGRKDKAIIKKLHAFSSDIISRRRSKFDVEETRATHDADNSDLCIKNRHAMLDTLLLAEKDGLIDHDGICEEVDTFIFAGFDTTSVTLGFILVNLACYPSVQQRCYEEIKQFISDDLSSLDSRKLNELKYMECVIKETQRLYSTVPEIMRECTEDTKLANNLFLPKGTQIYVHMFDLHRNEKYFERPNEFIPERFLPENSINRHPYAFIPFSAGRRNCIGQKYAMNEMKTLLVYILKYFELLPVTQPNSYTFLSGLLMRLQSKTFIKIAKRNK